MTHLIEQEIARYVDRVRSALSDLPPATRDELLEDLPEHLAEVAAEAATAGETAGSLTDRLGPPEAYARELRAAAGVAPPTAPANLDQRVGSLVRKGRDRLRAIDRRLGPVIGYERLSDYLRLLRPAWWVLRGYLAAMLIAFFAYGSSGLLPRLGGSTLAALLLLAATVTGSIWLGRRTASLGRRGTLMMRLGTGALVLFGLAGFIGWGSYTSPGIQYQPVYNDQYSDIRDVYVYDSEGRLLEGVRLFDQNGRPIRLGDPWCESAQERLRTTVGDPYYTDPAQQPYPYCPEGAPFRLHPTSPAPPAGPVASPRGSAVPSPGDGADPSPDGGADPSPIDSPDPTGTPADDASPEASPSPTS
ncbi:hypothetical protein [Plantactinospora sp. B5E13]|uniref:HAAS signaling domain-containing protein n=1 Tax=Plantactinospora sp. B5E13 TaxID=3153758 RepID=UPI00325E57AC